MCRLLFARYELPPNNERSIWSGRVAHWRIMNPTQHALIGALLARLIIIAGGLAPDIKKWRGA